MSKKENADAVLLVDNVKQVVEETKPVLPASLQVMFLNDLSYYIQRRLKVLSNNLLIGLILVLGILSMVLPFRVAMVTAIGIPFSFLGTMLYFQMSGISLNLITMMGLIIVIGILVDDAIVVTENAQRRFEEGLSPLKAAIAQGSRSLGSCHGLGAHHNHGICSDASHVWNFRKILFLFP